jgi:hypothetical protein
MNTHFGWRHNCSPYHTGGNQADMTSSSIFQSLNIEMNIIMVSLSYPKTRFTEIKSSPEKTHHQKNCS